jgi:hypothetical protein
MNQHLAMAVVPRTLTWSRVFTRVVHGDLQVDDAAKLTMDGKACTADEIKAKAGTTFTFEYSGKTVKLEASGSFVGSRGDVTFPCNLLGSLEGPMFF